MNNLIQSLASNTELRISLSRNWLVSLAAVFSIVTILKTAARETSNWLTNKPLTANVKLKMTISNSRKLTEKLCKVILMDKLLDKMCRVVNDRKTWSTSEPVCRLP